MCTMLCRLHGLIAVRHPVFPVFVDKGWYLRVSLTLTNGQFIPKSQAHASAFFFPSVYLFQWQTNSIKSGSSRLALSCTWPTCHSMSFCEVLCVVERFGRFILRAILTMLKLLKPWKNNNKPWFWPCRCYFLLFFVVFQCFSPKQFGQFRLWSLGQGMRDWSRCWLARDLLSRAARARFRTCGRLRAVLVVRAGETSQFTFWGSRDKSQAQGKLYIFQSEQLFCIALHKVIVSEKGPCYFLLAGAAFRALEDSWRVFMSSNCAFCETVVVFGSHTLTFMSLDKCSTLHALGSLFCRRRNSFQDEIWWDRKIVFRTGSGTSGLFLIWSDSSFFVLPEPSTSFDFARAILCGRCARRIAFAWAFPLRDPMRTLCAWDRSRLRLVCNLII